MTTTLGLGKEKKEKMRNHLPKTTHLGLIRLEPPMKVQTLLKVQELVPSNVLSVWAMVTLLQIAQQRGT